MKINYALIAIGCALLLMSCNKSLSSSKILKLIEENRSQSDAEVEDEQLTWYHIKIPIGKQELPLKSENRSDNSHFAPDQTLCYTNITNQSTRKPAKLKIICKPCNGCLYCIEKYKQAGLLDYEIIKDKGNDGVIANISLTAKGKEYVFISNSIQAYARYGKVRTLKVSDIMIDGNRATCNESTCFDELTPFATALGNKNGDAMIYSMEEPGRVRYQKINLRYLEDKGWTLE